MIEIYTEIEIGASAERIWQLLTDFPSYCQWNTVIHLIQGEAKAGARLQVHIRAPGGSSLSFRATVLQAEPGRELRWQGRLLLSGLFVGEHSFTIEPIGNSRVRFVQREVYTGLLAPIIFPIIRATNRRAFEDMNRALKARAERGLIE